jgi:hypothetical protein
VYYIEAQRKNTWAAGKSFKNIVEEGFYKYKSGASSKPKPESGPDSRRREV